MEKHESSILTQSLIYGLYFGLVMVALNLVMWMFNIMPTKFSVNIILFIVNLVIYFGLLFWFTKMYRNESLGGYISYGKAFLFALLVAFFGSVVSAVYTYIFNAFIDPGYMERIMQVTMESTENFMRERGLSQDQIDMAMARFENQEIPGPGKAALQSILGGVVYGLIVSLITSAFAKKQEEVVVY
ncbi:MAG TPA: DUF4199 domain-containing protein [Bacteroidetes bacterium]|nr:DUF4199 domain-containing protein [Bacteroidota bacterium]